MAWLRNTLCELIMAAGLAAGTSGCMVPGESVPQEQAEQSVESVVKDAIGYFQGKNAARAQGLLEQYRNHLTWKSKAVEPVPQIILALAYSANWNNNARTEFQNLVSRFEQNPNILEEAQDAFEKYKSEGFDLFATERYQSTEKLIDAWTRAEPKLNSALFFLKLLQHDYDSAKKYCKKTLSEYQGNVEKVREYFGIFLKLTREASKKHDFKRVEGYTTVLEAFIE